ncbi:MAG TPA: flagellar biosynthesis protein FlhB [Anaerolineae bacterium]|nr:flagellar biosynthesis protein FlhB [Anaerolineae bacterium]HRV90568.1 flagellar biosynthesis protein FlhB [Anaerolineae bacterium]
MSGERTEDPTPLRRREARKKGQVAKSPEINSAVILLTAFGLFGVVGPHTYRVLSALMERSFTAISTDDLTFGTLQSSGLAVGAMAVGAIAPLVLCLMLAGVVANVAQVGLMFSQKAVVPDFTRVSPLTGFKRLFALRGLVDLLKSLLKVVIIGVVVYLTLKDNYSTIIVIGQMSLAAGVSKLAQIGITMGLRVATIMLAIAAADYLYQRWEFEKSLRMTKQEVRDEAKQHENPQLKSRIRARQRELAMSRMMAAIPEADVVITNPTHIAVALRYTRGEMQVPKVVAKGQRLIAEKIKEKARQHHVPQVENKPLARALFGTVEIGQEIPAELYQAVAEVLAFVYRLKSPAKQHRSIG